MDIHWMEMVRYQQQIQKLSRLLLPVKHPEITASECELLAWLYLDPEKNTPAMLSQCSGMKKEAVSRCLKNLHDKQYIAKQPHSDDERSYQISLTETGLTQLKKGYEMILQPFYDLWREIGPDFQEFLKYADKVVSHLEENERR
ncbi:MAG: MarR family winged helix-turn-helix transcriptional regulator [Massiliimalia sp.]